MSMYLEHYGLAEAPFRITPHTDFFFAGANRGTTLEALIYAITHDEGIVKVSGEVGSGKTMLCRVLMERLPENVAIVYLANPSLSRDDILYALADELGIALPEHGRASAVLRILQEKLVELYAEGKQVVALIDEAHAMPKETLEEIRLLSNLESSRHKLLQLVLFGQPEINETLVRPDMRQLRERITHNFNLEPLVRDDIAQYLDFRMRAAGYRGPSVFAPAAIRLIADVSQGLTRRINILADKALLASFAAGGHQVGPREVRAAIKDSEFSSVRTGRSGPLGLPPAALWAGGGMLAMLALTGAWRLLAEPTSQPVAPSPDATLVAPAVAAANVPAPTAAASSQAGEPKPAAAEPPAPPLAEQKPAPSAALAAVATLPAPPATPSGSTTPLLDERLAASRPWFDAVAPDRWFIQLYSIDGARPAQAEAFLLRVRAAGLEMAQVRVYHSKLSGTARYGVIYGDYAARQDAIKARESLPAMLQSYRPYARSTVRLR
jgi:type II secretory pathway predicted ATPase ExeA